MVTDKEERMEVVNVLVFEKCSTNFHKTDINEMEERYCNNHNHCIRLPCLDLDKSRYFSGKLLSAEQFAPDVWYIIRERCRNIFVSNVTDRSKIHLDYDVLQQL